MAFAPGPGIDDGAGRGLALGDIFARNLPVKTKSVYLTMEKINIPGSPFLSLVGYKNLDTLYFRVYKVNRTKMNEVKKEFAEYYNKHKTYINYEEILIGHFAKCIKNLILYV